MVVVTHNIKVVQQVSDHLLVMRQGTVIEAGPTAQIVTHPSLDYTR